jgi:hypothetical protein
LIKLNGESKLGIFKSKYLKHYYETCIDYLNSIHLPFYVIEYAMQWAKRNSATIRAYVRKIANNYAQTIRQSGNGIIQVYHEVEAILNKLSDVAIT